MKRVFLLLVAPAAPLACSVVLDLGGAPGATTDLGGNAATDGTSVVDSSASGSGAPTCAHIPLAVQPAVGAWEVDYGQGGAAICKPPNPVEDAFGDTTTPAGPGVTFSARSMGAACCGCIGRRKRFRFQPLPGCTFPFQKNQAVLHGSWLDTSYTGTYSAPSLRVVFLLGNVEGGSKEYTTAPHADDNCGNPNLTVLLPKASPFDLNLIFGGGAEFDELDIIVEGYACDYGAQHGTNGVVLGDLWLEVKPPP